MPEKARQYTVGKPNARKQRKKRLLRFRFLAGGDADCVIRFRVSQVFRNVRLQVSLDGNVLLDRKKRAMAPGEMEEVKLRREWIKDWIEAEPENEGTGRLEIRICEEVQPA